jgi:hypothetical protein
LKNKQNNADNAESTKESKYKRLYQHKFAEKYDDETIEAIADRMYQWFTTSYSDKTGKSKDRLWLKDFAISEMIGKQRLSEFAAKNEYFNFIFEICKDRQESILFHLGLLGKSSMPIFALKAVMGWRDDNGENSHGTEYAELAKIFGEALVRVAGAGKTASNHSAVPQ